jgi:hypothetical protein
MDKFKELSVEDKIKQIKDDYNNEWWRPSKIDDFDLKNKVNFQYFHSFFELDVDQYIGSI